MVRVVAHRTRHGRFASYFRKFKVEAEPPGCHCGATLEPRHLTVCPRNWKVTREIKATFKIKSEEELYKFVMGKGHGWPGSQRSDQAN